MTDTTATEPTLRFGDQGADGWVEYLQHLLNGAGFPVTVTGVFDEATRQEVVRLQLRRGLLADGVVGNQTWASLREEDPRPIGTDGLDPHTFQEVGPEARWFTEPGPPVFLPELDALVLPAVNTGSVSLSPGEFPAVATVTRDVDQSEQVVAQFPLALITEGSQPAPPGALVSYVAFGFSTQLGPGVHTVVATMPAELGGDEAIFGVEVGGSVVPPPPSTGPEFGVRIVSMEADSQGVTYTAQAVGTRGGAGADILVWITDDQAETEAVQVPFEIGPRGTYQRFIPTPGPVRARFDSRPGLGFTVELSTNAGAGGQGTIDRQSRSVPGFSGGF